MEGFTVSEFKVATKLTEIKREAKCLYHLKRKRWLQHMNHRHPSIPTPPPEKPNTLAYHFSIYITIRKRSDRKLINKHVRNCGYLL